MKCLSCGSEINENSNFCGNCGTRVAEPESAAGEVSAVEEPVAEKPVVEEPIVEEPAVEEPIVEEPAVEEPVIEEPVIEETIVEEAIIEEPIIEEPTSKAPKKNLSFVFAVIAIAVVGLFAAALMKTGGPGINERNSVVYFTKESMMLADLKAKGEPAEITDSWHEDKSNEAMIGIWGTHYLSKDGHYIYYMEDCEGSEYYMVFDLYKASVANPAEAVKIDTKVDRFQILDNNHVVYERKGSLYYHDGDNKLKFGKNVWQYQLDEDQSHILWMERSKNYLTTICYQRLDQSEKKVTLIDDLSGYRYYYDDKLEQIYALDDNTVYQLSPDNKKEKLIKKVDDIIGCNPDTGAFYFIREGKSGTELYYFKDGTEELVSGDMVYEDYSDYTTSRAAYCLFREYDGLKQVYKLAIGAAAFELDIEDLSELNASYHELQTTERLFVFSDSDDDGEKIMYEVSLEGDQAGEVKEYDTEVSRMIACADHGVYYMKDFDGDGGDLYFNGEFVASDVYNTLSIPEADRILVLSDYDRDDCSVTVTIYDEENLTTIAEDIIAVEANEDGTLLMLSDYNVKRYKGDLLYYDGNSIYHIAEDVKGFLPRYNSSFRNYYSQY